MKRIVILLALALGSTSVFAQTKIGGTSPDINTNAVLELEAQNRGLLLPRLALESTTLANPLGAHVAGMTVYNTQKINDVSPGFYYNDGTKWQQMVTTDNKAVKFFYMPSIVFSTATAGQTTKDLYAEYVKQFSLASGNTASSVGAPVEIPYYPAATDLYYYVTDFDPTVFSNITIDANGLMTYTVVGNGTPTSIMNIVFVVK